MNWETLNWESLDRLRQGFLSGSAARGPYWTSDNDLAAYNGTYGERIGWKWDAVIAELRWRGWRPAPGIMLDWGCGSGVATRRILRAWSATAIDSLGLWDHSALAREFAARHTQAEFPELRIAHSALPSSTVGTLLISHVLNELSPDGRAELIAAIRSASSVVWVEPGTREVSRAMMQIRDEVLAEYAPIAPCPHQGRCPLFAEQNEADWCHFFAEPPEGIYADPNWVRFGQRAGIDLRSLPYSFLVLERRDQRGRAQSWPDDAARIIGTPEHFKGFARVLSCSRLGLQSLELQKRDDPALFKEWKRELGIPLFRWSIVKNRIQSARRLAPNEANSG